VIITSLMVAVDKVAVREFAGIFSSKKLCLTKNSWGIYRYRSDIVAAVHGYVSLKLLLSTRSS
jgi:hypothetical protein